MPQSPAQLDPHPSPHEEDEGVQDPSADGPEASGETADEEQPEFGTQKPTRFAADVEYRGRAGGHEYLVRVRHRLLDTSATVIIDGVEHDPQAEEKALKAAETGRRGRRAQSPIAHPPASDPLARSPAPTRRLPPTTCGSAARRGSARCASRCDAPAPTATTRTPR
ncbi:hypothetical protein H3H54_14810 [Brachybacterium sp. Z12]|uniref:hypothetical protein n=1 Tax=Brachybacterium sp. Z12 TaxID=2759167 RepID=UPI00185FF370|nr:hypothetical protein [Brachybacterium sp. Z12]QNN82311.1 hypothetical protein H3H54_14810 [Brachybacterium sp. Z12]